VFRCGKYHSRKVRLSASFLSRYTSILPVPLNSSKMTSSIRLPVSTRAVATMLSFPPPRYCGRLRRNAWDAEAHWNLGPGENTAAGRGNGVVGAGQTRDRIQEDDNVFAMLHTSLSLFNHHLRHLDVTLGRFVKRR